MRPPHTLLAPSSRKEFEAAKFDLVIVDIFLQVTNGFDVIKMMRERVAKSDHDLEKNARANRGVGCRDRVLGLRTPSD
jgi:CheY-like chemotaxis protein